MPAPFDLDAASFRDALQKGLGRCVLHLRLGGDRASVRGSLLEAFSRNLAHDPQSEGTRIEYLYDLAEAASMQGELRRAVLEALPVCNDRWDASQLSALALALARDGDRASAEALRRALDACPPDGPAFEGLAWATLELDGLPGLLRASGRLAEAPPTDARASTVAYLRSLAEEAHGPEAVERALASDPAVASIARAAVALEARWRSLAEGSGPATLDRLLDEARPSPGRPPRTRLGIGWARRAGPEEREKAAMLLAGAHEPWLQELLLGVFTREVFPHGTCVLLRLASSPEAEVKRGALRALSLLGGSEVRAFAMDELGADPPRWGAIRLLASTYLPGDGELVHRSLERLSPIDDDLVHAVGFDLIEALSGQGRGEDVLAPLGWLYERTPCSFCRRDVASELAGRGALTGARAEECAWDCNEETRSLVLGLSP